VTGVDGAASAWFTLTVYLPHYYQDTTIHGATANTLHPVTYHDASKPQVML